VRICWKQFATSLPKEESALSGRLLSIRPALSDGSVIKVSVDNHMVATDISRMRPQIEEFLRQQLQNRTLSIAVAIEETQSTHKIYSRVEQFQILEQRNPALQRMREALDLDLS
jgi:DNA polymerase-3 subunit gamma/tau